MDWISSVKIHTIFVGVNTSEIQARIMDDIKMDAKEEKVTFWAEFIWLWIGLSSGLFRTQ